MNKQYKKEMLNSLSDNTASAVMEKMLDDIGRDLSTILNNGYKCQTTADIMTYLKDKGLYTESN